jgi:hypothetical protein
MTDENNNLPVHLGDGFDDYGGDETNLIIRGERLKFTNSYEWLTKGDELIEPDREFVIVEIIRVNQRWINGQNKPETRILGPNEPWPDTDLQNAAVPQSEWRDHFGERKGPFENAWVAYLMDFRTMEGFTFPTTSKGGFACFRELKDAVRRARLMLGPHAHPLVTLTDAFFTKNFGGKRRPCFKIKKFLTLGVESSTPTLPQQQPAQLEAGEKQGKVGNTDLDDEIPW